MSNLKNKVQSLIGKECWSVVAGKNTGSSISLDIGEKIPRKTPLKNPFISDDAQKYEPEYDLYVLCSWRLDSNTEVICGALDDNSEGGKMLEGLKKIIGQSIVSVDVAEVSYDLKILFSNALSLKIFCNQTDENSGDENYMFFTREEIFTIETNSRLEVEMRNLED